MKTVLLLGDSIRLCYQNEVKTLLAGDADVYFPDDNGRFAKYTYFNLKDWLVRFPLPDVIHWNNGLWDTMLRYEGKPFTALGEYLRDMENVYRILSGTGAKLIFALTTPVDRAVRDDWDNTVIAEYNRAMLDFLRGKDVVINDLFSLASGHAERFYCPDGCHPSEYGAQLCGKQVSDMIRSVFSDAVGGDISGT